LRLMPPGMSEEKTVIGWREKLEFVDWPIKSVRAKIDTGARTSALDAINVEELPDNQVRFLVRTRKNNLKAFKEITAPIERKCEVRSSNGKMETRIFVKTMIRIGEHSKEVEFSLVDRRDMKCRALIGRSALEGSFIVDCSHKHVISHPVRTRKK